jgi:hypothetical protein
MSLEALLSLYTLPHCCFLRPNMPNSIEECGEPTSTPPSRKRRSSWNTDEEAPTISGPRKKGKMPIFSALKNWSTTPPSIFNYTTRNFVLVVFVKQIFVIFQTVEPTEYILEKIWTCRSVCVSTTRNPPYAEIRLNGQDAAYIYQRALKRKKVLQDRVVSLIKCKMIGSGM